METVIVPILQSARGEHRSKDNYQPIALANTLSKIFDKNLFWLDTAHWYEPHRLNLDLRVIVQLTCVFLAWSK